MDKNKKKILILSGVIVAITLVIGVTYSWFNYRAEGENNQIIAGDIYLTYVEGNNQISLTNIFPETKEEARSRNDNYITFTLSGKNESEEDLYYEILLNHGDEKSSPKSRYRDQDLRFDLIQLDNSNNEVGYLLSAVNYQTLTNQRIWAERIVGNSSSVVSKKYKLRMWLDEDVTISDTLEGATYSATDYKNKYATVKVSIYGDFTPKSYISLYDAIKTDAVIDNLNNASKFINNSTPGINFGAISSDTNGKGVYIRSGTENDDKPILYYRGEVDNNNVYFAGFCWKIVRTTDTGGVKLIYAGRPTSDATHDVICDNTTGATTTISSSAFNSNYTSPAYVGYMYGDVYNRVNAYNNNTSTSDHEGAYFGTGFNYENGEYSLKGAKLGIDSTHHYSCNSTSETGTCESIRYYYYYGVYSGTTYHIYITLTGGDSVLDAINKMQKNTNNSLAKTKIDEWYSLNMTSYTSKLEDTIWCNDRSISTLGGWNESGGELTSSLYFNGVKRKDTTKIPSLECENQNDAFTVSNSKGNKQLTYPVALITSDEIMLAGGQAAENTTYYLYTGATHWSLSPYLFTIANAYGFGVTPSGTLDNYGVYNSLGLRPAVSLKPGTTFLSGDGTGNTPYIID